MIEGSPHCLQASALLSREKCYSIQLDAVPSQVVSSCVGEAKVKAWI